MIYGLGNNGGTPGGRLGGAFPEVVATELRVEAVTVELLPKLRPRLLPLFRLEETLTTGGGAETVLDVVEKCWRKNGDSPHSPHLCAKEWMLKSVQKMLMRKGYSAV